MPGPAGAYDYIYLHALMYQSESCLPKKGVINLQRYAPDLLVAACANVWEICNQWRYSQSGIQLPKNCK